MMKNRHPFSVLFTNFIKLLHNGNVSVCHGACFIFRTTQWVLIEFNIGRSILKVGRRV